MSKPGPAASHHISEQTTLGQLAELLKQLNIAQLRLSVLAGGGREALLSTGKYTYRAMGATEAAAIADALGALGAEVLAGENGRLRGLLDSAIKENEYVRERLRVAEAVRDDARAASARDLEQRRLDAAAAEARLADQCRSAAAQLDAERKEAAAERRAASLPGVTDDDLEEAIRIVDMHSAEYDLSGALTILRTLKTTT